MASPAWLAGPGIDGAFEPEAIALADLAVSALIDEAALSPKPGLVDSRGNGAHADLNLDLMRISARALHPAFAEMAAAGMRAARPGVALRERLGALGRDAETAMMRATGGINTHRGAIWSLGLLVGAAGVHRDTRSAHGVARTAGAIARLPDRHRPARTGNKGERACIDYGVSGARGQAQAGFPHVLRAGLPELQRSRARGDAEPSARVNALLAIMRRLDDTCVLARAGREGLALMQEGASQVLAAGGIATLAGRRLLRRLEAGMLACNASPGGAADLLAATFFLDRLPSATPPVHCPVQGDN
ncbi:triphosphoribosyl-dephospho-CoA synthase [Cupriavidus sp. SK-3]|uniref:triphosphoribosyl-dephospho-CoA synthase n=1 Tax=unclassified Cupriavidus TaxID=2640874 RepID=UPI00044E27CA|nr:triphosphoribosyl-dephospho-CoA synthase [Cupriavidus sp. SK-3]KDP85485.1 triphosphoribosyl-dephospho-CoA synthase [Cupriavidus sp. SK-3]